MMRRTLATYLALIPSVAGFSLDRYAPPKYSRRLAIPWRVGEPCPEVLVIEHAKLIDDELPDQINTGISIMAQCPNVQAWNIRGLPTANANDRNEATFKLERDEDGRPTVKTLKLERSSWCFDGETSDANLVEQLSVYFNTFGAQDITTLEFGGSVPMSLAVNGTWDYLPSLNTVALEHSPDSLDASLGLLLSLHDTHAGSGQAVGLTNLTWASGWDPLVLKPVLQQHGATLETLKLGKRERWIFYYDERPKPLATTDLQLIAEYAPNLKQLQIPLDRNCTRSGCDWPWDGLKALASSTSLQNIDFLIQPVDDFNGYMSWRRGRGKGSKKVKPLLSVSVADELFALMREKNKVESLERASFKLPDGDCDERCRKGDCDPVSLSDCVVECNLRRDDGTRKIDESLCVAIKEKSKYSDFDFGGYSVGSQESYTDLESDEDSGLTVSADGDTVDPEESLAVSVGEDVFETDANQVHVEF